jgi:hypothetical protein
MKPRGSRWLAAAGLGLLLMLAAGGLAVAQEAQGAGAAQGSQPSQPSEKIFKNEQLDQMLAPVALYPDSLLSQLLMAATYPSDFAEAMAWAKANPKATGDDAVKQVESKPWDPSVKSLVAFPQVLEQFGVQPDWIQNVGDAFLAQPEDVMAAVQRLRTQAQKAGTLKTNEQQKVIVQQEPSAPSTTVIQIEPANPQVVYVPTYNPTVVYGSWAYPAYPPYYYPPPPYYYHPVASGLAAGIAFGVGIAAINSCWGGFNWGHNDVNINVNRYNNINVNNRISGNGNVNWNHNAANRRGTPYADNRSRQNYGQGVAGANNRAAYRGNTAADANRQRAQQSFNKSTGYTGGNRAGGTGAAGAGNRAAGAGAGNRAGGGATAGNRASAGATASNRAAGGGGANRNYAGGGPGGGERASSASRSNAFSGANSPQSAQRQSSRGQASQRSMSSGGGHSGGGRQVSRPTPSRGGGGGGRKR